MDNLYERIETLGKEHGCDNITVLCRAAGVPRAVMSELKSGRTNELSIRNVTKFAEFFGISVSELIGEKTKKAVTIDDEKNAILLDNERMVRFPVIGSICAGYDCLAVEEYTGDYALIPFADLHGNQNDYFVLRVSGNSMYPRLLDGDRVLVHRSSTVEDGKIAVVLYNGDEATVKKISGCGKKCLELIPFNPEYEIKRIEGTDLEQCRILGEVKQLIRTL